MKRLFISGCLLILLVSETGFAGEQVDFFVDRWALFLENDNAGWLEVRQEDGYLDSDMLWCWGSVTPSASTLMMDNKLIVTRIGNRVRERDTNKKPVKTHTLTSWFEFEKAGPNQIIGRGWNPNDKGTAYEEIRLVGKRLPPMPPKPDLSKLKFGKKIKLFNGKDLTGWKLINPDAVNGWGVKDGMLVNNPVQKEGEPHINYGNLQTIPEFEDFNLKLEVNIPKRSNSGIYLRGLYEVQVDDSYGREVDSHNLGAIYSRITPSVAAEKPAGEWQTLDITLCVRHINVVLNGTTIIDNQPVYGVTGGALTADEFSPGPIYLQGDHGKVSYRNIVLKAIKD
ncbi:DUF1080 domain-containing protein [candidate division KSB1 bacterium]|nr:DUF1080 domain-containing protein [candidate division KSB1 bacterium]